MSEEQNVAILQELYNAVNQRRLTSLAAFIHPDYRRHDLSNALSVVTKSGAATDIVALLLRALPDMCIEGKQFVARDDRVAVQFTITGTHQGDFLGTAGTGKRVELNGINIYRLKDGKITETWQLADFWGILDQMGKE